jgi:integrase/recombinase XerD
MSHGGRGHGPRLHDLRHTFAVHRLEDWYRQGADLGAKLPVLSAYMGHQSLAGTQR